MAKRCPRRLGKTPTRVNHPVTVDGPGGLTEGNLELT
jgi:hypothetical protein